MFVYDLKTEFFNLLIGKRILVIVNYDIDAICASKILQSLFKYENVLYSVVPIMGLSGLQKAFDDNKDDVKYVVLINCGICFDIVEILQPDENIIFFISDSHRPIDVCNIYSDSQVRILGPPNSDENIPPFEVIFRDDDDDDDDDDIVEDDDNNENDDDNNENIDEDNENSNGTNRVLSRTEKIERQMAKRHERKKWEDERDKIMFNYSQFSYYTNSTALQFFELAWKLSKDSMDLLWWSIVGITEQLILGKIENSHYTLECDRIKSHVLRLMNKSSNQDQQTSVKIIFEQDLHLALYRHWNVKDSLKYSMYSACKLKLWTLKGEKKLHELLVEMGLPLVQAKQTFSAMDLVLRKEFYQMIERLADKYNLPDIIYGSFTLQYGYRNKYSAADYVYAMLAILESTKKDRTSENCFLEALDSLSRTNKLILDTGISKSKLFLCAIFKQVQCSLELKQIHSAGPFLYYILQEESNYFSYPYGLLLLAKFILHGYVAVARSRRAPEQPLIATCPIDLESGLCLMIGVPPICEDSPKNFFGKAFEQTAIKSNSIILQDFFDTTLIQIRQTDITKFLDALTVLLS